MIKEFIESGSHILEVGGKWFEHYKKVKEVTLTESERVRLLYLECKRNLSLVDVFKLTSEPSNQDSDFFLLIDALDLTILEVIYSLDQGTNSNSNFIKFLEEKIKSPTNGLKEDRKVNKTKPNPEKESTLLEAIEFLYIKIYTLKKLAYIFKERLKQTNPGKAMGQIWFKARIINIKECLLLIVSKLKEKINQYKW